MTATIIYPESFYEPTVFLFPLSQPIENTTEVLDFIYRQCNHVDGNEWIANKKLRSMSVGDMVILGNDVYVCCVCGWKKAEELVNYHLTK